MLLYLRYNIVHRVSTENRKSKIFEIFDVRKYFEPFEKNLRNFEFSEIFDENFSVSRENFRRKIFDFAKIFGFRKNFSKNYAFSINF